MDSAVALEIHVKNLSSKSNKSFGEPKSHSPSVKKDIDQKLEQTLWLATIPELMDIFQLRRKKHPYHMAEPQRVFSASCRIQLEELHRSLGLHTEAKGIYKEWNLVMVLMSAFSHDWKIQSQKSPLKQPRVKWYTFLPRARTQRLCTAASSQPGKLKRILFCS